LRLSARCLRRNSHECVLGYSPTLRLWYPSLVLIDAPCFKFYATLAGSVESLLLLLAYASCFRIHHELEGEVNQ
jgi:hypothetical protein